MSTPTNDPPADAALRPAKLTIVALAGAVILLTLIFASVPMKVFALVICLSTLQGLWRGAIELAGIVLGMLIGVLLAKPLGIAFEGATASIFSTGGMVNRGLSMAIVAVIITALIAITFKFTAGRALKKKESIAKFDKLAGAALGLVEGSLIGLMVLWVPLALEPVASAQLAALEAGETTQPNPAAQRVLAFAKQVRGSAMGDFVESTNPAQGSHLMTLANDAAAIARDPERFEHMLDHDAIVRLQELDSFKEAMDMLNSDPELWSLFDSGEIDSQAIRQLANSPTMLRIIDETSLVDDIGPLIEGLNDAIAQAAAITER